MGEYSLGKLVKELQKLTVHSLPLPEKLTCETKFARWEACCKDYLQGLDARAHSGVILDLLDDEADFHRRYQQPGESIKDFQQALRLLGRRAFPTLDAKALSNRVLEQLVAGVRDPQIRKILLRDRSPTLEKAFALAREEEVLQAVCE
ncbi:unnamed protein product [Schistocephalus solidus]|uniref:Uncharacterized protein n=1 Tax=Schistocephalus solidus TaxID=70667 RepID=A0A183S7K8_SCHSO|nr:unnamed protein product [Schistocephalus solidus]